MALHFLVDEPPTDGPAVRDAAPGDEIIITGAEAHHAAVVRRVRVGEEGTVGDGAGVWLTGVVAASAPKRVAVTVTGRTVTQTPTPRLVLAQALAKGDRDELAVQAATELGVDEIVPWQGARSVSRWSGDKAVKGVARWQSIVREAAKQAHRPWVPRVSTPVSIGRLAARAADARVLVLDRRQRGDRARRRPRGRHRSRRTRRAGRGRSHRRPPRRHGPSHLDGRTRCPRCRQRPPRPLVTGADYTRSMSEPSIFTRILEGEIPAEILAETENVFAIRDIAPQAPVHLLIIPKTGAYRDVVELAASDPALLSEMIALANALAAEHADGDFRLVFNTGPGAGQTVFHVHAHVLAGGLDEGSLDG